MLLGTAQYASSTRRSMVGSVDGAVWYTVADAANWMRSLGSSAELSAGSAVNPLELYSSGTHILTVKFPAPEPDAVVTAAKDGKPEDVGSWRPPWPTRD